MGIPKTKKLRFSDHAYARMSERGIKKEYVIRAVELGSMVYFPIWYDKITGSKKKSIKEYTLDIPEKGTLIVVVSACYGLVVTCYFDIPITEI